MLKFCNTIFHTCICLLYCIDSSFRFFRLISHKFKNQEQTNSDFLLQLLFPYLPPKMAIPNIIMLIFYQIFLCHCSLLHNQIYHIIYFSNSLKVIRTTHGFQHVSFRKCAWLNQLVDVCIRQLFGSEIYFPILSYGWIGFGLCLSRELVLHLSTQANNSLLAV